MHDIEEGRLTWADSTQWAINRLSASIVKSQVKVNTKVRRRFVAIITKATVLMKEITGSLGITVLFVQNRDETTLIQKLSIKSVYLNRKDKIRINRGQVLHLNQN